MSLLISTLAFHSFGSAKPQSVVEIQAQGEQKIGFGSVGLVVVSLRSEDTLET